MTPLLHDITISDKLSMTADNLKALSVERKDLIVILLFAMFIAGFLFGIAIEHRVSDEVRVERAKK